MKRVMVTLMVLLVAGLTISTSGAFSIPSSLSGLSTPSLGSSGGLSSFGFPSDLSGTGTTTGAGTTAAGTGSADTGSPYSSLSNTGSNSPYSSLDSFSYPTSTYGVSQPDLSTLGSSSPLSNMQFFSPTDQATTQPISSIPSSDTQSIANMLSQLPTENQMENYYGASATATPAPNSTDTFKTNVSSTIPDGDVLFIDINKDTELLDPSSQGFASPNVTMNYKYDDSNKILTLKRKAGLDVNSTQIIFGVEDCNDVTDIYVFDYDLGSSPISAISVTFHGADGRIAVTINGVEHDLFAGQQAQSVASSGNQQISYTVTDYGLIPKSNVVVTDTLSS